MEESVPVVAANDEQHQSQAGGGGGGGGKREEEEVSLHPEANAKASPYANFFGKHRLTAAITNLRNQINIIQEELDELETLGESSIVCRELISSVESIPDPLLPTSMGPADVSWDRWFRGAHNSRNHKRWI